MSGRNYIAPEPEGICAFCGKLAELRPYGPNDERICYDCGMKQPEVTKRKMNKYIHGEESA